MDWAESTPSNRRDFRQEIAFFGSVGFYGDKLKQISIYDKMTRSEKEVAELLKNLGIGKNLTKRDKKLLSVAYVFYVGFDGVNAMEKLKFLTFIDKYLVLIGMICIVFGAIVQIIGLLF